MGVMGRIDGMWATCERVGNAVIPSPDHWIVLFEKEIRSKWGDLIPWAAQT